MFFTNILNDNQEFKNETELFYSSQITYLIATVILCLATLLAIPGNILVIWVVLKTPVLRSKAVNLLIVNLCVVDLISTWIDIPLMWTILEFNYNRIKTIEWICKCQLFFHAISTAGQAFAFVTVGYERYHTVANPFDKENIRKMTHISIISCWIIAIIVAFVELFLVPDTITYEFCMKSSQLTKHLAISYIIAPFGVLCFILVGFYYSRIVWLVRKHCKTANTTCRNLPLSSNTTDPSTMSGILNSEMPSIFGDICVLDDKNRSLGKRRIEAETAKRSLFVILSFTLICLPYPILVGIEKMFESINYANIYEWQYCAHTLSTLSAGLNPLLYGLANKQFRSAFSRICSRYYRRYKDRLLIK
jgi:hypothetical protein